MPTGEVTTLDNLERAGPADRVRVNVNETRECEWWCKTWNVAEARLREAVEEVGDMSADVAKYLSERFQ